jgi:hypothetical protein
MLESGEPIAASPINVVSADDNSGEATALGLGKRSLFHR